MAASGQAHKSGHAHKILMVVYGLRPCRGQHPVSMSCYPLFRFAPACPACLPDPRGPAFLRIRSCSSREIGADFTAYSKQSCGASGLWRPAARNRGRAPGALPGHPAQQAAPEAGAESRRSDLRRLRSGILTPLKRVRQCRHRNALFGMSAGMVPGRAKLAGAFTGLSEGCGVAL